MIVYTVLFLCFSLNKMQIMEDVREGCDANPPSSPGHAEQENGGSPALIKEVKSEEIGIEENGVEALKGDEIEEVKVKEEDFEEVKKSDEEADKVELEENRCVFFSAKTYLLQCVLTNKFFI